MPEKKTTTPPPPHPLAAAPPAQAAYQKSDDTPVTLGIISLVAWLIVPLLGSMIGIVLAAIGLNIAKKQQGHGRGLNIAGLITNICLTALQLLVVVGMILLIVFSAGVYEGSGSSFDEETEFPESSIQRDEQQHT